MTTKDVAPGTERYTVRTARGRSLSWREVVDSTNGKVVYVSMFGHHADSEAHRLNNGGAPQPE